MFDHLKRLLFKIFRQFSTAYAKRRVAQFGKGFTVNFPCLFSPNTHIGNYCHFNGLKVRGIGNFRIGDYFHSGEDILIITQNHNYHNPKFLPYDEVDIPRNVIIGNYVWVGSRVILLPGTELEDGCIVQAGAVVAGKFPRNAIIGGNPAKIMKYRDVNIVNTLVTQDRFLH
jgi:acetyltransferase-like isoleucine patch superfamily enzyme